MPHRFTGALFGAPLLAGLLGLAVTAAPAQAETAGAAACPVAGTWLSSGDGTTLAVDRVFAEASGAGVVLLGENHLNAEHHRWQLHSLAALHGRQPHLVVAFEAFPRRVQPVLDRWVAGELTVDQFLREVEWSEVWGIDPGLYLPLFHFARINRVPMVALNVERSLISQVGQEGWAAISEEAREGVGDPIAPDPAYVDFLVESWLQHQPSATDEPAEESEEAAAPAGEEVADEAQLDPEAAKQDPAFQRFVEAQLAWDRAMAEALATARAGAEAPLVVGIVGSGHLRMGHGISHQLVDLGIEDARVLLPLDLDPDCRVPPAGYADALFALEPPAPSAAEAPKPRLGVFIETSDEGVRVSQLVEGSVAEAAGLVAGDFIVAAAGLPIGESGQLIEIVQRQAPGTWLPLQVRRGRVTLEIVARFPAHSEEHP